MAAKKTTKKTTSRNNTKRKTTNIRNTKKSPAKQSSPFAREIAFVIIVLLCILMVLSLFGVCGVVGEGISDFLFGLFGILAYVFPFILLLGAGFILSNINNMFIRKKVIFGGCFYLLLTAIFDWALDERITSIGKIYTNAARDHVGGGFFGGSISYGLQQMLGRAGSIVVILALVIIFFILFTGKLLFKSIRELFEWDGEEDEVEVEEYPKKTKAMAAQNQGKQMKMDDKQMKSYKFPGGKKKSKAETKEPEEATEKPAKSKKRRTKDIVPETKPADAPVEIIPDKKMEEPAISIIRAEDGDGGNRVPVFEEELENKFGKKGPDKEVPITATSDPVFDLKADTKPDLFDDIDTSVDAATLMEQAKPEEKPKKAPKVTEEEAEAVHKEIEENMQKKKVDYKFPTLDLLNAPKTNRKRSSDQELIDTAKKLQDTLNSFGVKVTMGDVSCGPSVTRYELVPAQGVKVSKILSLSDDIKLSLAASDIRIEAPIPGKAAIGIEVPNSDRMMITFRELLESEEFGKATSKLAFAVGKDILGKTIVTDVAKMPHLLVAGATGSGKSVCINTLIMSILYHAHPDDVKMILIDPKVVEFSIYNDIPHLMIPVVTDPKKASAALNWGVAEMTSRYQKFADLGVRDIKGYNKRIEKMTVEDDNYQKMPQIVIVVDEFADLMMVAQKDVEDAICRLAQLARAAGIHLVLATQRPSVNVITGVIKANIPSRIALSVSSNTDSRTIIDTGGAEKLLGNGDMLFAPSDYPKPVRVQGAFISEKEVQAVVDFLKGQFDTPSYNEDITKHLDTAQANSGGAAAAMSGGNDRDDLFVEIGKFIIEKDKASIGMLQRTFRIGFNRAARIMDQLCDAGVVGPEEGTKPRTVLMSEEQFENYLEQEG